MNLDPGREAPGHGSLLLKLEAKDFARAQCGRRSVLYRESVTSIVMSKENSLNSNKLLGAMPSPLFLFSLPPNLPKTYANQ